MKRKHFFSPSKACLCNFHVQLTMYMRLLVFFVCIIRMYLYKTIITFQKKKIIIHIGIKSNISYLGHLIINYKCIFIYIFTFLNIKKEKINANLTFIIYLSNFYVLLNSHVCYELLVISAGVYMYWSFSLSRGVAMPFY